MYEKLDVYDENRNKTGRIIERKEGEILSSDEYILAIQCWIINSNNEILLTKRKATKKDGNMWEPQVDLCNQEKTVWTVQKEN